MPAGNEPLFILVPRNQGAANSIALRNNRLYATRASDVPLWGVSPQLAVASISMATLHGRKAFRISTGRNADFQLTGHLPLELAISIDSTGSTFTVARLDNCHGRVEIFDGKMKVQLHSAQPRTRYSMLNTCRLIVKLAGRHGEINEQVAFELWLTPRPPTIDALKTYRQTVTWKGFKTNGNRVSHQYNSHQSLTSCRRRTMPVLMVPKSFSITSTVSQQS